MTTPGEPATPGRPRSERARQAVLTAARELLTDKGLPGLSVDDIARSAGVSKNTIYRWWPNKAAVLMDAFAEATSSKLEFPADGDALTNLRTQVRQVAHLMNTPRARRPFVALVAASQHDPELATALRERFIATRRAGAHGLISKAIDTGEFRRTLDPDIIIDLIYGALYYRLLITGAPLDADYADHLLDNIEPALRPDPALQNP
ncbi:TetR/AcrR family transcriptional regulator [Nocardia sp. NBC_01327]|uniref:TetR/AcrR family transcriptional regulator n=1 Tax=Nocardia sp. NBC_01327 TaxID=2903593 RepID=UPI002E10D41F|nr:TetR/AcrR family transcriptional regulator [Nocardia sp. NBC_01327]